MNTTQRVRLVVPITLHFTAGQMRVMAAAATAGGHSSIEGWAESILMAKRPRKPCAILPADTPPGDTSLLVQIEAFARFDIDAQAKALGLPRDRWAHGVLLAAVNKHVADQHGASVRLSDHLLPDPGPERRRQLSDEGFDPDTVEDIIERERFAIHPLPANVIPFHPKRFRFAR